MSAFDFGVGLFPTEPLQKMIHLAKVSEELGFTHIWVGDSHLIWREAYVNMAAMALNTTKVKLGTGVTNPLTRHPSVLASAYATLEEYSPGRMIVGIGLGDSSVETMGLKPSTLANFEKSLEQMRELFAGKEAATADRERFTCFIRVKTRCRFIGPPAGRECSSFPAASPTGSLYWSASLTSTSRMQKKRSPPALKPLAESYPISILVLWVPCAVSDTASAKDAVKAHVARVVAHPLPYVLDPNEQKVLEEIRKTYDYYHHMDQQANHAEVIPDWLVDKFAIAGSVDQCRAQIARIKETGIQQIAIIPYSPPGGSREETIRGFAKAMRLTQV